MQTAFYYSKKNRQEIIEKIKGIKVYESLSLAKTYNFS